VGGAAVLTANRTKRLYRVTATYVTDRAPDGTVLRSYTVVRHYQSAQAAHQRAARMRTGYHVEARSIEDGGYRVEPAATVTIERSQPVVWEPATDTTQETPA